MIKIENDEVMGWEAAIRGMRNPMNSWKKSDTRWYLIGTPGTNPAAANDKYLREKYCIGDNDLDLMKRLAKAGTDHRKFMRMIAVYTDITAPLYWWKEYDTYKVGTVANSCSTMHKIAEKEFTENDFSFENVVSDVATIDFFLGRLNYARDRYLETKDKKYWYSMIQLLPNSYNQRRTVMLNYEVLANIYKSRKEHKLDEWRVFCDWIQTLPLSELITGGTDE